MTDAAITQARTRPQSRASDVYKSSGWWGIVFTIATEGAIFAYLLFSYYYMAIEARPDWPNAYPSLKLALPNTFILLFSSLTFWWSERQFRTSRRSEALIGLGVTALLGVIFIAVQLVEWHGKNFSISSGPYGSLYFTITGFHMAHVIIGLIITLALMAWLALGVIEDRRHAGISIGAAYWHFVDAVWLTVFFTFYLTPYLI
jgi:heme/copper-type cytochrome/quinol oxidase subunit 3